MTTIIKHKKLVLALLACGALFSPQSQAVPTEFRVFLAGLKSAASLSILPASIAFGNVSVGQSASTTVTISNSGGTAATNLQYLPTSNFSVSGGCGSTLSANSQCTETVTFTPTAGQSYSGNLTVTNGGTLTTVAGLSGTGLLTADQTSTTSLNFGNQAVGVASSAQSVQLNNTGNTTLTVGQISTTGPYAATHNCGTSLAIGGSCTVNVTFTPTAINSNPGLLSLTTNAGTQGVTLAGNGQQAQLGVSPSSLAFGNVTTGQSTAHNFTLTNSGNIAATSLAINPPSGYTQTNNCGTSLAAQASCTVSVTFAPTASTTYSGNLQITSSATTVSVPVSGTGVCASGSQIFTNSGTFSPVAGCSTYRVVAVGGGGGGSGLQGTVSGGGGGGGYVSVGTYNVTAAVAVTVGGQGVGGSYSVGGQGGTSCFGSYICAAGGYGGNQNPGGAGGTGGGYGSNIGGTGGTNGSASSDGGATGQGAYASALATFTKNSLTAGAGGAGGTLNASTKYGGGGGGVLLNGATPNAYYGGAGLVEGSTSYAGAAGAGYGAGGGGGAVICLSQCLPGGGGYGMPGLVYVEWSQ